MNYNPLLYACGTIFLGIVGFWFGDFALQWQAVPKEIPRMPLADVSAAMLVLAVSSALSGSALLIRKYATIEA